MSAKKENRVKTVQLAYGEGCKVRGQSVLLSGVVHESLLEKV